MHLARALSLALHLSEWEPSEIKIYLHSLLAGWCAAGRFYIFMYLD